ncbi:10105_t:CDS:1, partial [Scutellospora calospora]
CVFNYRNAVQINTKKALGHTGWGFQIGGTNYYIYGSDDGPDKNNVKNWHQYNNTRANMMNWFKNQHYNYYVCEKVPNSAVTAALKMISTVKNKPYNIPQSYSLSDTIKILTAYNAPGIPPFTDLPSSYIPSDWFDNLPYDGNSKYGGSWSNFKDCC